MRRRVWRTICTVRRLKRPEVKDRCAKIIATQQPLAKGLRKVLVANSFEMPKQMIHIINFMFVVWFLERIADHATSIGEWVIYHVTGEHKDMNP